MRRGHLAQLRRAVMHYQTVAVGHAAVKIKLATAEMLLHSLDYLRGLLRGNIAAGVVEHGLCAVIRLVAQGNKVAAQGNVRIAHVDSDAHRLKGRTAGIALLRVESEHAHICNIAAGLQTLGNGSHKSDLAL